MNDDGLREISEKSRVKAGINLGKSQSHSEISEIKSRTILEISPRLRRDLVA